MLVGSAKDAENNAENPENLLTRTNGRLQLRTLTIRRKTAHRKTSVQCVQYAICSMTHNNTQNQEKESGDSMTNMVIGIIAVIVIVFALAVCLKDDRGDE